MKLNLPLVTIALSTFLLTSFAFAKNIDLYDQPKKDAKIVGKIDTETGIIPIFTPKDTNWVKVADPRNGNVGWIQSNELNSTGNTSFTFTQSIVNNGSPTQNYMIQFGSPQKLTPEEAQAMFKKMEIRQQAIQKDMQDMMNTMFKNTQMTTPMPVFVPVIMVPTQQSAAPKKAAEVKAKP